VGLVLARPWEPSGTIPVHVWRTAPVSAAPVVNPARRKQKEVYLMAKRYGRPSLQYRYEHYDPRW
jgi:hypothetical protein